MGTAITLKVGDIELTFSKNAMGYDHGSLFQEKDRTTHPSDQINYDYFLENPQEDISALEASFVRPLREVIPRLKMLGYKLENAQQEYEAAVAEAEESQIMLSRLLPALTNLDEKFLNFAEFCSFATQFPITTLNDTHVERAERLEQIPGRFINDPRIKRIPDNYNTPWAYSEVSYFSQLIKIIHPYHVLLILAENPENLDVNVVWQYGPIVNAGWIDIAEFTPNAKREEAFLIATEGKTDIEIIQHAISLLRPEISDFFKFIDVNHGHPIPGTGGLVKLAEVYSKTGVDKMTVVLFDNDAEGFQNYKKLRKTKLPINIQGAILPELEQFNNVSTVDNAYNETDVANINCRAAAIECYLDLELDSLPPPKIKWSKDYKSNPKTCQGTLVDKELYRLKFLEQTAMTIRDGRYNTGKLEVLLDQIILICQTMLNFKYGSVQ